VNNPYAQYPFELDMKTYLSAANVADPFRLMDCSPITDGAAAIIMVPLEHAHKYTDKPVKIKGIGSATGPIALHDHKDLTRLDAVRISGERAYKMAGVGPNDIQFAEVHDCFSIAQILVAEELGFFPVGTAGKAIAAGQGTYGGKLVINPSGGLKAKGHPVGATGVAQLIEATFQLQGRAGKRQIENAKIGLTQNMGGSGGTSVVHILEAV
jgi:acetyl-CoA C-acetyltransferase